jgi:hypothetical protein
MPTSRAPGGFEGPVDVELHDRVGHDGRTRNGRPRVCRYVNQGPGLVIDSGSYNDPYGLTASVDREGRAAWDRRHPNLMRLSSVVLWKIEV